MDKSGQRTISSYEVIDNLSDPAKRLFYSLDHNSQRRVLKQAKEIAGQNIKKRKLKERIKGKSIQKREIRKQNNRKRSGSISVGRRDAAFSNVRSVTHISEPVHETKEVIPAHLTQAMEYLILPVQYPVWWGNLQDVCRAV